MKEAQIDRLLGHARTHASRARVLLRNGNPEQARTHTERAQRTLGIIAHARAINAVAQFLK
jgi:hypothetical protein